MISLTNYDSSEGEQWGRDEIYPDEFFMVNPTKPPGFHVALLQLPQRPKAVGPEQIWRLCQEELRLRQGDR